jgi:hypothetical protein
VAAAQRAEPGPTEPATLPGGGLRGFPMMAWEFVSKLEESPRKMGKSIGKDGKELFFVLWNICNVQAAHRQKYQGVDGPGSMGGTSGATSLRNHQNGS